MGETFSMPDFPRRNHSTLCSSTTIRAQKTVVLHCFPFRLFLVLSQAILFFIVVPILGSFHTAVHCTVGTERTCGQKHVVSIYTLIHADRLGWALTCLLRPAANMHIPGFRTSAFHTAHQTSQLFEILALLWLLPVGRRGSLDLRAGLSLFFPATLAHLFFLVLLFNPSFLSISPKVFPVSGLELSLRWRLGSSVSLYSLVLFAAVVKIGGVPVDGAGVCEWAHIAREGTGRHLREKKTDVHYDLRLERARWGSTARKVELWARISTNYNYEEPTRIRVTEQTAIVGRQMAGKHRVTVLGAAVLDSLLCSTLLLLLCTRLQIPLLCTHMLERRTSVLQKKEV